MPRFYGLMIHPYDNGAEVFLVDGHGIRSDQERSFTGYKASPKDVCGAVREFLLWEAEVANHQLTEDTRRYLEETA